MRRGFRYAIAAAVVLSPTLVGAQAAGTFSGSGYSYYNSGCGACGGYLWHTGDYWQQYTGPTGLTSSGSLGLDLSFNNVLSSGMSQVFAVLLNGTTVGNFTVNSGQTSYSNLYNFASVAGLGGANDEYTIRLLQTSADIPSGYGSTRIESWSTYALASGDEVGPVPVPEPASIGLLATGLVSVFGAARRRRTRVV